MHAKTLSLVAMLALVPAAVQAQSGNAQSQAESHASTVSQADVGAQARIDAALEHAMSVGIPASMLESKVAEGRAKGVSMARIAAAVEHRLEVLSRVQTAFGGRFESTSEAEAGATALESGASLDAVQKVHERAGPGDRAMALSVLAQLVADGKASEHALMQVTAALQHGAAALAKLGSGENRMEVEAGARSGANVSTRTHGGAGVQVGRGGAAGGVRIGGN